jgi:predicted DNA-binding ribbon-helix-helix protein
MKSSVAKRSKSTVLKRSVVLAGNKTSLSLEDEFWNGLREIARGRGETLSHLITAIDDHRQHTNLSSAVRLFVLGFYQEQHAKNHSHKQFGCLGRPSHPSPKLTIRLMLNHRARPWQHPHLLRP